MGGWDRPNLENSRFFLNPSLRLKIEIFTFHGAFGPIFIFVFLTKSILPFLRYIQKAYFETMSYRASKFNSVRKTCGASADKIGEMGCRVTNNLICPVYEWSFGDADTRYSCLLLVLLARISNLFFHSLE